MASRVDRRSETTFSDLSALRRASSWRVSKRPKSCVATSRSGFRRARYSDKISDFSGAACASFIVLPVPSRILMKQAAAGSDLNLPTTTVEFSTVVRKEFSSAVSCQMTLSPFVSSVSFSINLSICASKLTLDSRLLHVDSHFFENFSSIREAAESSATVSNREILSRTSFAAARACSAAVRAPRAKPDGESESRHAG